eukprot:scaffold2173_cov58-Phaeocystis_antarctica.AAC.1
MTRTPTVFGSLHFSISSSVTLAPGGRSWHRGSTLRSSASCASHAASTSTVSANAALSAEALGARRAWPAAPRSARPPASSWPAALRSVAKLARKARYTRRRSSSASHVITDSRPRRPGPIAVDANEPFNPATKRALHTLLQDPIQRGGVGGGQQANSVGRSGPSRAPVLRRSTSASPQTQRVVPNYAPALHPPTIWPRPEFRQNLFEIWV